MARQVQGETRQQYGIELSGATRRSVVGTRALEGNLALSVELTMCLPYDPATLLLYNLEKRI